MPFWSLHNTCFPTSRDGWVAQPDCYAEKPMITKISESERRGQASAAYIGARSEGDGAAPLHITSETIMRILFN